MRSFWAAAAIGAVLIIGGIYEFFSIQKLSDKLISDSKAASEFITAGDFSSAGDKAEELSDILDKRTMILGSIINHERIDEIELCISELSAYCRSGVGYEALVRCEKLEHLFFHLPANYSITLENIL